ncbi:hypothetical protein D9M69_478170 [compost metagenome]
MELHMDSLAVQLFNELEQIGQRASEAINAVHVDSVTLADILEHCLKLGAICSCTTHLVRKRLIDLHTIQLTISVLINRANANVSDLCHFPAPCIHLNLETATLSVFIIEINPIEYVFPWSGVFTGLRSWGCTQLNTGDGWACRPIDINGNLPELEQ